MKIEVNNPVLSQLAADRSTKQVSSGGPTVSSGLTEDRATLHSDSASVQTLTAQALQSPAVRQDKVAALTEAVRSGQYNPDPTETAAAILESEDN